MNDRPPALLVSFLTTIIALVLLISAIAIFYGILYMIVMYPITILGIIGFLFCWFIVHHINYSL